MTIQPNMQTVEDLRRECRELRRRRFKFGPLFWSDLDRPGEQYEWIIKGVIPAKEIVLAYGESQAGKSFLISDLGMCVARGEPYQGRRVKQGLVIYVALEAGRGFRQRMKAYRTYHGITDEIPFVALTSRIDLFRSETDIADLIADIKGIQETIGEELRMVVLDTWSAGTRGANENSGEDVGRVLDRVYRLRDECDCSVIIVHHKPKGGNTPRGHGSLTGDLETTIEIVKGEERDEDSRPKRVVRVTKQREGEDKVQWEFVLKSVVIGKDSDGDDVTSCVVLPPAGSDGTVREQSTVSPRQGARMTEDGRWFLRPNLLTGMRALNEAVKRSGRRPPDHVRAPHDATCVTLAEWRDEWQRTVQGEDEAPEQLKERVKKARDRAVEKFVPAGFIGKDGDWVWRTGKKVFEVDAAPRAKEQDLPPLPPEAGDDLPF